MLFERARIPTVTETQWRKLAEFLSEQRPHAQVEPHAIATAAAIRISTARAFLFELDRLGACDVRVSIYHCVDSPVDERRLREGPLQPLPWRCPDCERVIVEPRELSYEEFVVMLTSIEWA